MTFEAALETRARSGKLVDQSDFKAGWKAATAQRDEEVSKLVEALILSQLPHGYAKQCPCYSCAALAPFLPPAVQAGKEKT